MPQLSRYVKSLWYASTAGEDESVWREIIDDVAKGYVEIGRRCISVFAQMLFSACEAYYSSWEDIDEEIVLPQARIPESNGLYTMKSIVPKKIMSTPKLLPVDPVLAAPYGILKKYTCNDNSI